MSVLDNILKDATFRELHPYASPEIKEQIKEALAQLVWDTKITGTTLTGVKADIIEEIKKL